VLRNLTTVEGDAVDLRNSEETSTDEVNFQSSHDVEVRHAMMRTLAGVLRHLPP
jgi:hypothetical protein